MNFYTARYGNKHVVGLASEGALPIGISWGKPKYPVGYEFRSCHGLAPRREWFELGREVYTKRYLAKIERLDVEGVLKLIQVTADFDEDATVILLCFEDLRIDGKWCHRRILGDWLTERGVACRELEETASRTYEKSKQMELFG